VIVSPILNARSPKQAGALTVPLLNHLHVSVFLPPRFLKGRLATCTYGLSRPTDANPGIAPASHRPDGRIKLSRRKMAQQLQFCMSSDEEQDRP
jgi:hypothetical protein